MENSEIDITSYMLIDSESVGMVFCHTPSLEHFRDHVVAPSLKTLTNKLEELKANMSDDLGLVFLISDIEDLMKRTIEGYILTLQAMWERGLRGMLVDCDRKIGNGKAEAAITKAAWAGKKENLQDHFLRLLGIPIDCFSSFKDLDLLQTLGNAIRHGDGGSARRLYELSPSLWPAWSKSTGIFLPGAIEDEFSTGQPNIPQFDQINIETNVLEQMMKSTLWFWDDIENMRCNSFRRKPDSVIRKLASWRKDIDQRVRLRTWNVG